MFAFYCRSVATLDVLVYAYALVDCHDRQVASHAQKHFLRVGGATKRRSRFSQIEQEVGRHPLGFEISVQKAGSCSKLTSALGHMTRLFVGLYLRLCCPELAPEFVVGALRRLAWRFTHGGWTDQIAST